MGAESQRSGSGSLRPVKTGPYKKRSSYPVSHKTVCRPLLPSGPGGVEQRLVAQDLTSQTTHQKPNRLQKCETNETVARSGRADIWGGNARLCARIPPRGADRDRTDDLFVANEALSQLSYSPPNHQFLQILSVKIRNFKLGGNSNYPSLVQQ